MLEISQKLSQFFQSLTLSCSQRLKLPKNALFWNGYIKTHTHTQDSFIWKLVTHEYLSIL